MSLKQCNASCDYNGILIMEWGDTFEHARSRLLTRAGLSNHIEVPKDEEVWIPTTKENEKSFNEIN